MRVVLGFIVLTLSACGVKTMDQAESSADYSTEIVHLDIGFEKAYSRIAERYAKYFEFDGTVYSDHAVATSGNPSIGYMWIVELVPEGDGTRATVRTLEDRLEPDNLIETLRSGNG